MQFIGGGSQQEYVERTRGLDPSNCLAAGIDVGKYEALCLVGGHRGEVVGEALTFSLTEPGERSLEAMLAAATPSRGAVSTPIRTETAPRDRVAAASIASKDRPPGSVSENVNASPTTSPR